MPVPGTNRSITFFAKAQWSDRELLRRVAQWIVPLMDFASEGWWIIDDTGFPKKGAHSVGVTRQYCGVLGKQDNCQVAASVSLACEEGSLPVAWQLYLPAVWAQDDLSTASAGTSQAPPAAVDKSASECSTNSLRDSGPREPLTVAVHYLLACAHPLYPSGELTLNWRS